MNRLLAAALTMAAGCTSAPDPVDSDTDTDTPIPVWPQPALSFSAPADGTVATDGAVSITVTVTNFDLTPMLPVDARRRAPPPLPLLWLIPTADAHQPGDKPKGFIGLTVDDLTDTEPPRDWLATDQTTFTLTGLPAGELVVTGQLYWPDPNTSGGYDSFYPPVLDTLRVVVPGEDTDVPDTDDSDEAP